MMLAFICAPAAGSAEKRAGGVARSALSSDAPCGTCRRTAARPRRHTPRRCRTRPGAAARRPSCAGRQRQREIGLPRRMRLEVRITAAQAATGTHVSVMTGALSREGTSADATATERRAAARQLRRASALRTGARGAATKALRSAGAAARCGAAEQRAGAAARARAALRSTRTATAAGTAAVNAIASRLTPPKSGAKLLWRRCDTG
jgi:hypothetical protein